MGKKQVEKGVARKRVFLAHASLTPNVGLIKWRNVPNLFLGGRQAFQFFFKSILRDGEQAIPWGRGVTASPPPSNGPKRCP